MPGKHPDIDPPMTVSDLMKATGFGRDKVKRMMREGLLPGIVDGRSYSCPRTMYEGWCEGRWQPRQTTPSQPVSMIRRRSPKRQGDPS